MYTRRSAWFTRRRTADRASAVDSTADFLNSVQLPKLHKAPACSVCRFSMGRLYWALKQCQQNVTSKNLTVIDCLQLSYTKTHDDKKWSHFRRAGTLHFHFLSEYSKLDRVVTMGTRGKINAVWWNIKINLQKLVDMWIWLANKLANYHAKRLNRNESIPKIFRGLLFWGNRR